MPDLAARIDGIVTASHLTPDIIMIEITEQDISNAPDRMRAQIEEIHRRGYALWVDDFGSGYSSLNVMDEFPFDLIKFDQKLLMNRNSGRRGNSYILAAMTSIAGQLGIRVWQKGWKRKMICAFCSRSAASMRRASCSTGRWRQLHSLPCWKKSRNYAEDCIVCW